MVSVFLKLFLWLEHGFQCVNCYSSMSNETNLVGHYHFNKNEIENRKYECSFCSKGKYCLMKLSCVYITLLLGWCKCNCGFCIVEICCLILKYILNKCGYGYISFFLNFFIFKLYNIVLVLPNIEMNPPQEPQIRLPTSDGSLKNKRVSEKHLFLLYWLCQSLWLCGSQ